MPPYAGAAFQKRPGHPRGAPSESAGTGGPLDHETARILASLGLADALPSLSEPAEDYERRNGEGETLLRLAFDDTGHSGWPLSA
ncbi:hypothetical protein AB0H29_16650 [Streptomyces thermolilacinus]